MSRGERRSLPSFQNVPRASGDEPNLESGLVFNTGMFPARAGMSRLDIFLSRLFPDVPRASGDEPTVAQLGEGLLQCSPRERG